MTLATTDADLSNSEAFSNALYMQSHISLGVLDAYLGSFIECNVATLQAHGFTDREAFLSKTFVDLSPEYQRDGSLSAESFPHRLHQALAESMVIFEWLHQRPDGSVWDAEVQLIKFNAGCRPFLHFSLRDISLKKLIEEENRQLNSELEQQIEEQRRSEIGEANRQLNETLITLKNTQASLVRSEKLASLGSLVAGIAHELNTPLGNSFTVATSLSDATKEFLKEVNGGQLRRSVLTHYLEQTEQATDLIYRNLSRANELITHFKQIAVDQTSEHRRQFNLKTYIQELMLTLQPQFKHTRCTVVIDIPDAIILNSYPGPLGQVITNLTLNALIHGFEDNPDGVIQLTAKPIEDHSVLITLSDNGSGIDEQNLAKIFDPFFTTRLGKGGSGLGLHIVYSNVHQLLNGTIEVTSKRHCGTTFTLIIPLVASTVPHATAS
ncbi:MAG: ATP-binding protein [Methylovulum sp.]|jgi:signal transduction histidine kinase